MDYCADCTYCNPSDYKGSCNGLFYCEERCDYVFGNNPKCGDFCRAYSRSDYEIKDMIKKGEQERSSSNSSCYLTTIISIILGYGDKGYALEKLRSFRNNILQKDNRYKRLLVEYDFIGPLIAREIAKYENKELLAKNFYDNFIKKILVELEHGNYDKAVDIYVGMTYGLQVCFGLAGISIDPSVINDQDITKAGHGKVLVR